MTESYLAVCSMVSSLMMVIVLSAWPWWMASSTSVLATKPIALQELFNQEELTGYLKNMRPATKAVCAGGVEKGFAEDLEKNDSVKVYAKLPGWFRVPTPLSTYNPDWAVLVEVDGMEKLYFVVETKSSLFDEDLRDKESAKIKCGIAHFEALSVGENPATYMVARNINDLMARVV